MKNEDSINELALFAGVGGGILGSKLLGWKTICAVERDPYAASVLIQRQNDKLLSPFPIWDDVRTFDGRKWRGFVDVISGGFPCQAFSTAARGRNNAQDFWPEMRRIVGEVRPRYVFAENVSSFAINIACDDLNAMGYKSEAISLSAKDLGADHIRKRYWLLAYTDDKSKLLCGLNAKTLMRSIVCHSVWKTEPDQSRMANGVAFRMDRYRAIGNGQVPIVVIGALATLCDS